MQRSHKGNRESQVSSVIDSTEITANLLVKACDACWQRMAKCDEGMPKCSLCVENPMDCR